MLCPPWYTTPFHLIKSCLFQHTSKQLCTCGHIYDALLLPFRPHNHLVQLRRWVSISKIVVSVPTVFFCLEIFSPKKPRKIPPHIWGSFHFPMGKKSSPKKTTTHTRWRRRGGSIESSTKPLLGRSTGGAAR